jgi:hypothetical protein
MLSDILLSDNMMLLNNLLSDYMVLSDNRFIVFFFFQETLPAHSLHRIKLFPQFIIH